MADSLSIKDIKTILMKGRAPMVNNSPRTVIIPADSLMFRDIKDGLEVSIYRVAYDSPWGEYKVTVKRGQLSLFVSHTASVTNAKSLASAFMHKKAEAK